MKSVAFSLDGTGGYFDQIKLTDMLLEKIQTEEKSLHGQADHDLIDRPAH